MNNMNPKDPHQDMRIELFATSDGVYAIDSPVRVKILSLLREGELSFDKIAELSGKAKSTVSVHLKKMAKEGIIGSKQDPDDARKKIFFIKSEYLGKLSSKKMLKDGIDKYVSSYVESNGNPFEFFRMIFQTIRVSLLKQGINIDPILYEAGEKVGEAIYKELADSDMDKFVGNIAKFWETHELGHVEVGNLEPLTVNVYDCFECQGLPYLGRPACAFDSGILKTIFSAHFQDEQAVNEVKCYATGDDYCSFVIKDCKKINKTN